MEEILMPGQSNSGTDDTSELISNEIQDVIKSKKVKTYIVREESEVETPSYLFDFSKLSLVLPCTILSMGNMVGDDGDTSVYILNSNKDIVHIGKGDREVLYRTLEVYVKNLFKQDVTIYFNDGGGFKRLKPYSVESVVLRM